MDLRIPLFDAIVQGNENAVLNVLYLSGYNENLSFINNGNQSNTKKGYILKSIKDDMGRNPLHWAASNHLSEKLVSLLIEHGTPLLSADSQGWTPLHVHCARGRVYGVAALLFHGADANCKATLKLDNSGKSEVILTPIEIATRHNHSEIVRILLAYGATPPSTFEEVLENSSS